MTSVTLSHELLSHELPSHELPREISQCIILIVTKQITAPSIIIFIIKDMTRENFHNN